MGMAENILMAICVIVVLFIVMLFMLVYIWCVSMTYSSKDDLNENNNIVEKSNYEKNLSKLQNNYKYSYEN